MPGSYLGMGTATSQQHQLLGGEHHHHQTSSSPYTHPHYLHRVHYFPKPSGGPRTTTTGPNGGGGNNNNGSSGGGSATTLSTTSAIQEQLRKEQHEMEEAWLRLGHQPKTVGDGGRGDTTTIKGRGSGGIVDVGDKIEIVSDSYSYVQFAPERPPVAVHEYSYPMVDSVKGGGGEIPGGGGGRPAVDAVSKKLKGDASSAAHCGSVGVTQPPPPLPTSKSKWKREHRKRGKFKHLLINRVNCKYCRESFSEEDNERGSCEYAPDRVRSCINAVTCLSCAQCMLYHCMADSEGDFAHHPCTCDRSDDNCSKRWLGLALLSFFVPCLWCYLPLSTCHRCSVHYGLCGGRHKAS